MSRTDPATASGTDAAQPTGSHAAAEVPATTRQNGTTQPAGTGDAARQTGSAAAQVQSAAAELAAQSLTVKRDVDSFLSDIQAA